MLHTQSIFWLTAANRKGGGNAFSQFDLAEPACHDCRLGTDAPDTGEQRLQIIKNRSQAMSDQTPLTIRLSPADNVVVARAELLPGAPIAGTNVTCLDRIPRSHKVT